MAHATTKLSRADLIERIRSAPTPVALAAAAGEFLDFAVAEAAAAERAAIRAAVKGIYLPLGEDIGYSRARDRALNDVVELLDARQS